MKLFSGIVCKIYGAWYEILQTNDTFTEIKSNLVLKAKLRGKLRLENKKGSRHLVFVGDNIRYSVADDDLQSIFIEELITRQNALYRSVSNSAHCLGANLDRALLIVSLKNPELKTGFIDRFLVSCHSGNIAPVLLFTKPDLLNETEMNQIQKVTNLYKSIGYECYMVNLLDKNNKKFEPLTQMLNKGTTLLCGFSGTGKSTFINFIIQKEVQKTATISESTHKGRHTTTNSTLFVHSNGNAMIIDTPGVKQWGIEHLSLQDVLYGFKEIHSNSAKCQFHDCLHSIDSLGCGIQEFYKQSKAGYDENSNKALLNKALMHPRRISSHKKMIEYISLFHQKKGSRNTSNKKRKTR